MKRGKKDFLAADERRFGGNLEEWHETGVWQYRDGYKPQKGGNRGWWWRHLKSRESVNGRKRLV